MDLFKLATSKQARELFNSARETMAQFSSGTKIKYPCPFNKNELRKVITLYSEQWMVAEMKDGGFALVYQPDNHIAFYSGNIVDIEIFRCMIHDFIEISMRNDAVKIIDNLVKSILTHKSYDPIFHATASGLDGYVGKRLMETDLKILNESITQFNETPAHVAAYHNQDILKLLIQDGFNWKKKTSIGNTVAHCASLHVDMIKILRNNFRQDEFHELVTTENDDGLTAVHLMMRKADVIEYMKKNFANVFSHKYRIPLIGVIDYLKIEDYDLAKTICETLKQFDKEFAHRPIDNLGATIIHRKMNHKVLKLILANADNSLVNIKDSKGFTPLHQWVNFLQPAGCLYLIVYGADTNALDNNNNSPLYYALQLKNTPIVKLLLLFNADYTKASNCSQAPKSYQELIQIGCFQRYEKEPRSYTFKDDRIDHIVLKNSLKALSSLKESTDFYNAISFDGGGMRGLVSLQILRELNNRFNGANIMEKFTSFAGTSTGSIITLAMAKHNDVEVVTKLFLKMKDDIFSGSRPYNGELLEQKLRQELGGDISLKQLAEQRKLRIAIAVARVNVSPPVLALYRSYEVPEKPTQDCLPKLDNYSAAKIARCSSAAPFYFPSVEGKYMDGGLVANNPSLDLLCDEQAIELISESPKPKLKMMLSIGTGRTELRQCEDVDLSLQYTGVSGLMKSVNSVMHMTNVFLDQLTLSDGMAVDRARMMASSMNAAFFRFSPLLKVKYELDDVDEQLLIEMMWETKVYMNSCLNDINILLAVLKNDF